jgi:glycine betaine transporter
MALSPKEILVAADFSAGSDEALAAAIDLAKRTGADLRILHVLELGVDEFPFGDLNGRKLNRVAHIDRELAERADQARRSGVVCHTWMLEGTAPSDIVDYARTMGADLIVVGTHGRRGLGHALLGSVAEKVVRRAHCPVLTVPFSKRAA